MRLTRDESQPVFEYARSYTPDFAAWLTNFGQLPANYDASNGTLVANEPSQKLDAFVYRSYGLTECPMFTSGRYGDAEAKRFGTDGRPVPGALKYDGFVQLENGVGMVRSLLDDWRKARRTALAGGLPRPVSAVLACATLGSVLGAIFFYYIGRALGPRRSHAFLDRLPLVETEDVDKTFAWFERHGRSAVFFGRMVPIVRSFISVPAGVVRMPLPQFVLYSAVGSLIWNSVLIGLGVAAGDFVQQNLHYLDYAVVTAFVLGIGYLVHKRWRDVRRHRQARSADPDESRSA